MAEPTPRDTLLDHAYEIADKYGLAALSVRGLASDCNVSVGTIYNHFASKGELATATTALYFKRAFYTDFCHPTKGERYLDFCKRMFDSMEKPSVISGSTGLKTPRHCPRQKRPSRDSAKKNSSTIFARV